MTEQQLKEIETRANAATPGPWEAVSPECFPCCSSGIVAYPDSKGVPLFCNDPLHTPASASCMDEDFVAHAREDVPALVAEVRALRGTIERYKRNVQRRLTLQLRMRERDE